MQKLSFTGTQINYFFICKRKLWLFSHDIQMEQHSDNVAIGKMIGEESYSRKKKEIEIDGRIKVDFFEKEGVVHEIKKTNKVEEAHIWQVKYYLYYLKQKGVENLRGEIDYPKLKKRKTVSLSNQDCEYLEGVFRQVDEIVGQEQPPLVINAKICKKCAYYGLCYV